MKYLIVLAFICVSSDIYSQDIKCTELIDYVEDVGTKDYWGLNEIDLFNSEWLNTVNRYKVEDVYVVVAEFKYWNGVFWEYKKYIFCGIPVRNWESFKALSFNNSYGEKFHQYIYDYKCNCTN